MAISPHQRKGDEARKVSIARADAHAARLAPTIRKLQASGVTTLRAIAAALNKRNIPTASGRGEWHPVQVWRVLARLSWPARAAGRDDAHPRNRPNHRRRHSGCEDCSSPGSAARYCFKHLLAWCEPYRF
jgi:hypothetical protein